MIEGRRQSGAAPETTTMSKVFFSVTISIDGFIAPESRFDDVGDERWMSQWGELQRYVFEQRFFRKALGIGEGGLTGDDNRILEETFLRTGVSIMGKRMFDGGERHWPEEAPFHTPVFVLTRQVRAPWERKGGTTFHFINDGIESALQKARAVAGGKDIRIAGGAHVIRAYLDAGLVDEMHLAIAPVFLGAGTPLFDRVPSDRLGLRIVETVPSSMVTHVRYAVQRRG
jgi:dihydrofolate reductase